MSDPSEVPEEIPYGDPPHYATDGGTKRMRVPSVLVDCRDCGAVIEVDARTFDLAVERGPGTFLCDDCRDEPNRAVDTGTPHPDGRGGE